MDHLFWPAAILALALPWAALIKARRHWSLDPFWYGLILVGAGTAMIARLVQMGLWIIYVQIAPLPDTLTAQQIVGRWDAIIATTFLLGPLIELAKSYGVVLFDTRMNHGNQTLYGFAVGAGAGLIQAFWVLGAVGWSIATGAHQASGTDLWLCLREGATVFMEASLTGLVMWHVAQNKRWGAVLGVGLIHGLALLLASQLSPLWAGPLITVALTMAAFMTLRHKIKTHGWPI